MPIEIKVLKQLGSVPAGVYAARYLNDKHSTFVLSVLNPCKEAQIIDGPHSGEILPYSAYIETGQLPAQADLLQVKERLVNDLAAVGQKITDYARKTGKLQETVEIIEDQKRYLAERVESLEKRNRELNTGTIDKAGIEIRRDILTIIWTWWNTPTPCVNARSNVHALADKICEYLRQHNARPF